MKALALALLLGACGYPDEIPTVNVGTIRVPLGSHFEAKVEFQQSMPPQTFQIQGGVLRATMPPPAGVGIELIYHRKF